MTLGTVVVWVGRVGGDVGVVGVGEGEFIFHTKTLPLLLTSFLPSSFFSPTNTPTQIKFLCCFSAGEAGAARLRRRRCEARGEGTLPLQHLQRRQPQQTGAWNSGDWAGGVGWAGRARRRVCGTGGMTAAERSVRFEQLHFVRWKAVHTERSAYSNTTQRVTCICRSSTCTCAVSATWRSWRASRVCCSRSPTSTSSA